MPHCLSFDIHRGCYPNVCAPFQRQSLCNFNQSLFKRWRLTAEIFDQGPIRSIESIILVGTPFCSLVNVGYLLCGVCRPNFLCLNQPVLVLLSAKKKRTVLILLFFCFEIGLEMVWIFQATMEIIYLFVFCVFHGVCL